MPPEKFEVLRTEIKNGTTLIEASAGTGKTFTIAFLVLRLLLERPELTIDRILVTTFTELATAELRRRIRERLRDALAVFKGAPTDDEMLRALRDAHRNDHAAADRLEQALLRFDEASIYTIHGFCQRVLSDRAFESGALFDPELLTNQQALLSEIVCDFWRKNFYNGGRLPALLATQGEITPKKLTQDIEELTRNPRLIILPETARTEDEIAAGLAKARKALRKDWATGKDGVRAIFERPLWAKGSYKNADHMAQIFAQIEDCLADDESDLAQWECIEVLSSSALRADTGKGKATPTHPVFETCQRICDLNSEIVAGLRARFFTYAREELRLRKLTRNLLSYEDLLLRLAEGLTGPGGKELAASIRARYGAALVDEFQDTDPVQYEIFARIYPGSEAPVAFIGDPKQAIYSFRGADVFTYMGAAHAAERQFTLTTNWRSESRLVGAVNSIFAGKENAFLLDEIQFHPVEPSLDADQRPFLIDGVAEAPFHIWTSDKEKDLPDRVASEIVRLLVSRATIGDDPLEPRHFAVLTSTNDQASEVQAALRERRVPSVLYSGANIFLSHEARELHQILAAVMQPGHERRVRAALCTDALGVRGNEIDQLSRDEAAWETEMLRFQQHHKTWRDHGFVQMLQQLATSHGVRQRLLGFPDGERRLTNFRHLSEALHTACVESRLGMNGVVKWLGQQMGGRSFADREEHELRLESDEKSVRIITVHKSKGLEFDVVFCPFVTWHRNLPRPAFHDPDNASRLTLDLSDSKAHESERKLEALAENARTFYVALTRAKHRCTMVWKPEKKADASACAHILGNDEQPAIHSDDVLVSPLPAPSETSYTATAETSPAFALEPFRGVIDRSWGLTSFSRLVSGRETDQLDDGPLLEKPAASSEAVPSHGIHDFPRGMRAGTCLHKAIEVVDFSDLAAARENVVQILRGYGMSEYEEIVRANLSAIASVPIDGFTLAQTAPGARIPELEFTFPVDRLTTAKLAAAFDQPLQFSQLSGFMNGLIDLIVEHDDRFYIIDWKSNWLGPDVSAYYPAALAAEMQKHLYTLQLSLYTVALHRYLQVRKSGYDYERHFGGAYYVFLRGLNPANSASGVYHERLSRARTEELSALFDR